MHFNFLNRAVTFSLSSVPKKKLPYYIMGPAESPRSSAQANPELQTSSKERLSNVLGHVVFFNFLNFS
jgi:hypothetical protein